MQLYYITADTHLDTQAKSQPDIYSIDPVYAVQGGIQIPPKSAIQSTYPGNFAPLSIVKLSENIHESIYRVDFGNRQRKVILFPFRFIIFIVETKVWHTFPDWVMLKMDTMRQPLYYPDIACTSKVFKLMEKGIIDFMVHKKVKDD